MSGSRIGELKQEWYDRKFNRYFKDEGRKAVHQQQRGFLSGNEDRMETVVQQPDALKVLQAKHRPGQASGVGMFSRSATREQAQKEQEKEPPKPPGKGSV